MKNLVINSLDCNIHEPEAFERTVVMVNGFNGSKDSPHRIQRTKAFAENGFRVLRWDYRSRTSGKATKTLTEDLNDLLSIIDYINCDVGLFGESWGGQLSFQAGARNERVKAVVARSPLVDFVYSHRIAKLKKSPPCAPNFVDDFGSYNTYEDVLRRAVPTLIFSGERDKTCPLEYARKLFSLLPESKKLVVFDEGHDWPSGPNYEHTTQEALAWLKKYL